ncbi:hypothetical protein HXX76_004776 [Chlamydomonas incerta]|uniref:Uncharacterized protein n=1 Tax=Chlamydomonas incerta TaxID=51695 RepID=A0A835T5X3_CHLIN|nr:hypothetical protein HXX76_004776 [Chlamydomonas incerta]|eukprot:KAG2439419.1 hypothetical protein HXX76_004776 [Chlamydomonas incerta]
MQKHGVAIGAVGGLLAAAVGAVWFASRLQARNEQAILEEQRKREQSILDEQRKRELGYERVQHELKEEKLQRKVEEERLRREMLQRVLDISYHADWQGVRERSKKSGGEDDSA